jgi:DHA1 family bicyclomycin/chloramphenicol resistance-like MFS transporter
LRIRPETFSFTILIAVLNTLSALAIDMALPAMSVMAKALGASATQSGLTISLFMFGFAAGPIIVGPLSDRFGRRPMIILCCALYAAGAATCALTPTILPMLAGRFIQGMGAGGTSVACLAMVRDCFSGRKLRVELSYITTVMGVTPMIAPSLGAITLGLGSWRSIYWVLGLGGASLLAIIYFAIKETAPTHQGSFTLRRLLSDYRQVLSDRLCVGYTLALTLSFGATFSYVSGSPLVLMEHLGVSTTTYAWMFALPAVSVIAGSFVSGKLSRRGFSAPKLLYAALCVSLLANLAALLLAAMHWDRTYTLMPLFMLHTFCFGFVMPNATHGALERLSHISGSVSAVLRSVQMVGGTVFSAAVAALYDGTSLSLTGGMTFGALTALLAYLFVVKPVETETPKAQSGNPPPDQATINP